MSRLVLLRRSLRVLTRISPSVASRLAVELFRTPHRYEAPPRERQQMEGARPFTVRLGDGTRVDAWSRGDGAPVLLAHGWEGRGSQMAPFIEPLVAAGFRAVTFDAPGHGTSSGRRSSLPQFASALGAVANATGAPAAIIGHSLGAAAAVLTTREGLAVGKLILVATPLDPGEYTWQFGEMIGVDRDVIARMRARIERQFNRRWSDYSLAAVAPSMKTPLLVIHDRDDRDTAWSGAATLAGLWPGARLLTTEGLGHRRILRDPGVIAAVVGFLRGS